MKNRTFFRGRAQRAVVAIALALPILAAFDSGTVAASGTTKYAGSSSEMVSLMADGGGGQYDLVSASGDADLRLIYGGDVKPVNVKLVPAWKQLRPFLQSPDFNTINGVHYGISLQFGPNDLLYSTKVFPTAPPSWSRTRPKRPASSR